MSRRVGLVHRLVYLVGRSGLFLASVMPEWLGYKLVAGVAYAYLALARRRMSIGVANARQALGDDLDERELRRIVRRGTANAVQNVLDLVHGIRLLRRGELERRLDLSQLRSADIEPPFIGCSAHLGSWEAGALAIARAFGECHALGRRVRNPLSDRFLRRYRGRGGIVAHPRRGGIRPLARALAEGKVAMQVVDQNQRLRGVFVPSFGRLASTDRSAASFAVRRGHPILVGAAIRTGPGYRFRVETLPPLRAERTGDREADVVAMAARINRALETLVRRHPDQYLWIHDRFRTRPPEERARLGREVASGPVDP